KSVYQSVFTVGPFKNKTFNWAILGSLVLLVMTLTVPFLEKIFHVTHLELSQWVVVLIGSFAMLVFVEIVKAVQRAMGRDKNAI
ncbi:cation-translocating P-type ATPase C-terminal domain-containing protein, partial [Streptococcus hyovaginalis]